MAEPTPHAPAQVPSADEAPTADDAVTKAPATDADDEDAPTGGAPAQPDRLSSRRSSDGLRTGWTTGTCSSVAAKACALLLVDGAAPDEVEVALVRGAGRARLPVLSCERVGPDTARAVVVKDAGDDPDVTHGAHITVTLTLHRRVGATDGGGTGAEAATGAGVTFVAGEGVGTVTRTGLGLDVGGPAVNAGPRKQIAAALSDVVDLERDGAVVEISVPGGNDLAQKTSNPRLGIVGGISILGTSGIVRPFSSAAWRASVGQAIDVMHAQGMGTAVLTTGGRSERFARRLLPELDPVCFIEVGDFIGYSLKRARTLGLDEVVMVGMAGKLAKVAAGELMTHSARSKVDPAFLADVTRAAGGDETLAAEVATVRTARHAFELWEARGLARATDLLCGHAEDTMAGYIKGALPVRVILTDFAAERVAGRSPQAVALAARELAPPPVD
ncbi:cobalt-precorrin-5B (C(1))-methyltransferase [Patulibacter americanus]|uniref:cobalt-precorrin-5B (C(1))-methyltransferase n=1 Tax=Patulibacter americanus TaxID=588672 RepID=UPI0003B59003|nr:cobalt-precorrin-5B (C(1))-methyltransferase [Patulibacter americanus]